MHNVNSNKKGRFVRPFIWNILINIEIPEIKNRRTVKSIGRDTQRDYQPNNSMQENPS
jgi:hypothetical protein